jgi:hypothetical protein
MRPKNPPDHMLPTLADANQSRLTPMPLKSSQFDFIDPNRETAEEETAEGDERGEGTSPLAPLEGINPFTRMAHNPATSEKQARFMRGCEHSPGSMSKPCPSKSVAKEFNHTAS